MNLIVESQIPKSLQDRLLAIGGSGFSLERELIAWRQTEGYKKHTEYLLVNGREFDGKANIIIGESGLCHVHAAALYFYSNCKATMWTGFALNDLGGWTEHSWNIFNKEIFETSGRLVRYFGYAHPNPELWATSELKNAGKWQDDPRKYADLLISDHEESVANFYKLPGPGTKW